MTSGTTWCAKYRRPVLSYFVATVGAVSAEMVQRYTETQYERAPKGSGRA